MSENAEYDAAKDEHRDIEARIEEIEKIIKYAEVADEDEIEQGVVNRVFFKLNATGQYLYVPH